MLLIQGPHFGSTVVNNLFSLSRSFALETLLDWGGKRLELGLVAQEVRSCVVVQRCTRQQFLVFMAPLPQPPPLNREPSKAKWAEHLLFLSIFFTALTSMRGTLCHLLPTSLHLCCLQLSGSSTLAWKIPWMEEPGRLQSPMGSLRVGHD